MILVRIIFKDKKYYEYSDVAFVDDAGMEKTAEGEYRSPESSSDEVMIWTSLDSIIALFKMEWFKEETVLFTRTVGDEEEDLFECYEFMAKEKT